MINRCSRRNEGNFIASIGFCKTLPNDIKDADVYYDWSCKLQSRITPPCQPTTDVTMGGLCSLQYAKKLLPIEDHWEISKMWSTDQGLAVARAIVSGNATGISDGFF